MKHLQYVNIFRSLATRHKEIQHTETAVKFLRVHLSSDFVQQNLDLQEFYSSLRSRKTPGVFLVLISYEASYSENFDDNPRKFITGDVLILDKCEKGDYAAKDEIYDRTETIGEELMAALREELYKIHPAYRMATTEISCEKIGPLANLYHGNKFSFRIAGPAGSGLVYNPDKFLP